MLTDRIGIEAFDRKFRCDPDPWGTWSGREERCKREAIMHSLSYPVVGRLLELGCGNGSNSVSLFRRSLRLDCIDGSKTAVDLTRTALGKHKNTRIFHLRLPGRIRSGPYDAVVIAELLYYMDAHELDRMAAETGRLIRPGGRLVLCHHHSQFRDAAIVQKSVHQLFISAIGRKLRLVHRRRSAHWLLEAYRFSRC